MITRCKSNPLKRKEANCWWGQALHSQCTSLSGWQEKKDCFKTCASKISLSRRGRRHIAKPREVKYAHITPDHVPFLLYFYKVDLLSFIKKPISRINDTVSTLWKIRPQFVIEIVNISLNIKFHTDSNLTNQWTSQNSYTVPHFKINDFMPFQDLTMSILRFVH